MTSAMQPISTLTDLAGKRVLVRCDLNVPLADGRITDDGRIVASAPTLRTLMEAGAHVVVCAHVGRPKGTHQPELSTEPIAVRLGEVLEHPVVHVPEVCGAEAQQAVAKLGDGDIALLENVRFDPRETSKDDAQRTELAGELAELADLFVSDGFGVVHRKQASVYDVARLLPAYAGSLVTKEVEVLKALTDEPRRPYTVVLGGSKVSDKLGVIENLLGVADRLLIGGGMMFTFLKAMGHEVGSSLLEEDQLDTVKRYLQIADDKNVEILLPTDTVAATKFAADAEHQVVPVDAIPADRMGLDIGPETAQAFAAAIAEAGTVFWNGPMGVFEMEPYSHGTKTVAEATASTNAFTVIGGGDSAAAVRQLGFSDDSFSHISTGGGASLEFLEGKTLPGLEVLETNGK